MSKSKKRIHSFHPLELSICGHSGSGKTTLIEKLIKRFSQELSVGYIKHDAHGFEMDKEGKDTFTASKAGAAQVCISSANKQAFLFNSSSDEIRIDYNMIDSDVVIIEGYKDSLMSKVLMWTGTEDDQKLLKRYTEQGDDSLLAIIGQGSTSPCEKLPYFNRDDIKSIYQFIKKFWDKKIQLRPLYGLILSGGHSTRMGQDKGAIEYHDKPQTNFLFELLDGVTQKSYISCRADQVDLAHLKGLPTITDQFIGFGPTGGILSALSKHPEAAWLIMACDMPYINKVTVEYLLEKRNPYKMSTCFYNEEKKWPEPLFAIYEPKAARKLGYSLINGKPCPRKVLMNSPVECLEPLNKKVLENANTLEDFQKIQAQFTEKY